MPIADKELQKYIRVAFKWLNRLGTIGTGITGLTIILGLAAVFIQWAYFGISLVVVNFWPLLVPAVFCLPGMWASKKMSETTLDDMRDLKIFDKKHRFNLIMAPVWFAVGVPIQNLVLILFCQKMTGDTLQPIYVFFVVGLVVSNIIASLALYQWFFWALLGCVMSLQKVSTLLTETMEKMVDVTKEGISNLSERVSELEKSQQN